MKRIEEVVKAGQMMFIVDYSSKLVTGSFKCYFSDIGVTLNLYAKAEAKKGDEFSEKVGLRLVKLKLMRKYYTYKKMVALSDIECIEKELKKSKSQLELANKKLKNINNSLEKNYDLKV